MSKFTFTIQSLGETEQLGAALAAICDGGITICLSGELGSGKTTLVRSLVASLGSRLSVSSPTFVLSHEYKIGDSITLEHWDLYRLGGAPEDLWEPPRATVIRVIEWAEREPRLLESAELRLLLSVPDPEACRRTVRVEGPRTGALRQKLTFVSGGFST